MKLKVFRILTLKYRINNFFVSLFIETYLFFQVIFIFKYIYILKDEVSLNLFNIYINYINFIYLIFLFLKFLNIFIIKFRFYKYFDILIISIINLVYLYFNYDKTAYCIILLLCFILIKIFSEISRYIIYNYIKNIKEEVIFINFSENEKKNINPMINPYFLKSLDDLNNFNIKNFSKRKINYVLVNCLKKENLNNIIIRVEHLSIITKYQNRYTILTYKHNFILNSLYYQLFKRFFDLIISFSAILILLPFFIIIAILIKVDSKGPILFIQKRHGFRKNIYNIIKFRSMYYDMQDIHASIQTKTNDNRITKIGSFIRKTNIDELPNLVNVLLGNMSLVGPRPHALKTKLKNNIFIYNCNNYNYRFLVRPGITSLSHVRKGSGQLDTIIKLKARINYDLIYINNFSFLLDLKIILMTIKIYLK